MKFQNIIIICLLFVLGVSLVIGQELWLPKDPLKGRLVFEKKGCLDCHAINGYGGKIGPDLGENPIYGSLLELAGIMWNHSPQMSSKMREIQAPRPQFSEQEMTELITYLYFLPYLGKPGDASRGKVLFSKKGCLRCHSVGAKGGSVGPSLDKLKRYLSPLYMAQAMWNHGPAMDKLMKKIGVKRPWLSGEEMVDLSAYIRQTSRGAPREEVYMSPGNPKQGQKVFIQKGCAKCHAVNSQGGNLGPDLAVAELKQSVSEIAAIMWNHGSDMWVRMEQKGVLRPQFSSKEMADLIAYLYFIAFTDRPGDAEQGKEVFVKKGCASCHSTSEGVKLIGPNLTKSRRITSPMAMIQIMWNHAQIMKARMLEKDLPWPEFKQQEMSDIYAYLQKFFNKTPK